MPLDNLICYRKNISLFLPSMVDRYVSKCLPLEMDKLVITIICIGVIPRDYILTVPISTANYLCSQCKGFSA